MTLVNIRILHTSKILRWSLVNKIPSFYYRLYMHDIQLCMHAINIVRILYTHSRFCYEISRHDLDVYYQRNYFLSDCRSRFLTILKRLNSIVSSNILHFKFCLNLHSLIREMFEKFLVFKQCNMSKRTEHRLLSLSLAIFHSNRNFQCDHKI